MHGVEYLIEYHTKPYLESLGIRESKGGVEAPDEHVGYVCWVLNTLNVSIQLSANDLYGIVSLVLYNPV